MKAILKAINYLVTAILLITLLLTLYLVISSKTSGDNMNLFGYQIKTVLSGSMEPDIETGSIIFINVDADKKQFEAGDVITFITEENVLVTHRIIDVKNRGEQFITKGDANDAADLEPVRMENVIGKYTGVMIPYVGYVMNFATSKEGVALLLIVPGVFFIIRAFVIVWQVAQHVGRTKEQVDKSNIT